MQTDLTAMKRILLVAGAGILWLIPARLLYFWMYATGWRRLLMPHIEVGRVGIGYVFFVTAVRDAVDRLLPVANVGGGLVGIKLTVARGVPLAAASATIIVEVLLTLIAAFVFASLSVVLVAQFEISPVQLAHLRLGLIVGLAVPVVSAILLRYGAVFARAERILRPIVGSTGLAVGAKALDREVRACLGRHSACLIDLALQIAALVSSSFEVWFLMRLFGHPISVAAAVAIEGLAQSVRHAAFFIPAGIGVQEGALLVMAGIFNFSPELALGVSIAKRIREVLCGLPALIAWQVFERRQPA